MNDRELLGMENANFAEGRDVRRVVTFHSDQSASLNLLYENAF